MAEYNMKSVGKTGTSLELGMAQDSQKAEPDDEAHADLTDLKGLEVVTAVQSVARMKVKIWLERIILNVILFADLIMSVVYICLPDERINDSAAGLGGITSDSAETFNSDLILMQYLFGIAVVLLNVIGSVLGILPVPPTPERFYTILVIKLVNIVLLLPSFAYPTTSRMAVLTVQLALSLASIILLGFILAKYVKHAYRKPVREIEASAAAHATEPVMRKFVARAEQIVELQELRKIYLKKFRKGQNYVCLYILLILLLAYGNAIFEFKKTLSTSDEFFDSTLTDKMNNEATFQNRTEVNTKIILVVIDGMNMDGFNSAEFKTLTEESSFYADSIAVNMEAQLPSMSVPNWLTLITGVKPELTGVWGNLLIPETRYDSIYRQASLFKINRGITSSAWFANLIKSQLPLLCGDGTVDLAYNPGETGWRTNNPTDERRGSVLMKAVQSDPAYPLFLAHFSDVDFQGHFYGVSSKYNTRNSYFGAIANKTKILRELVQTIDNNTVVIITSDHGMMDRGGHGGTKEEVIDVQAVIYKKGSNLRTVSSSYTGPKFQKKVWETVDIAPTISLLLGMPVPRQAIGVFLDVVMPIVNNTVLTLNMKDLFQQKQTFLKHYLDQTAQTTSVDASLLSNKYEGASAETYKDKINELVDTYTKIRLSTLDSELLRNIFVSIFLCGLLIAGYVFVLARVTFTEPLTLFSKHASWSRSHNRKAMLWGFGIVILYFALAWVVFKIAFVVYGYPVIWDSTYLHSPEASIVYVMFILIPGTVITWLLLRSFGVVYSDYPTRDGMSIIHYLGRMLRFLVIGSREDDGQDIGMIYLVKHYTLFALQTFLLVLFIFQSVFTFIIPYIFRIKYVSTDSWGYRFRVITVQFMSMPIAIGTVISFLSWPSFNERQNHMDGVYVLKIRKDLRLRKTTVGYHDSALDQLKESRTKILNDLTLVELFRHPEKTVGVALRGTTILSRSEAGAQSVSEV